MCLSIRQLYIHTNKTKLNKQSAICKTHFPQKFKTLQLLTYIIYKGRDLQNEDLTADVFYINN